MGLTKRIKIAQATIGGGGSRYVRIPDGPKAKKKKPDNGRPFMVNFLDVIINQAIRNRNHANRRTGNPALERPPEPEH